MAGITLAQAEAQLALALAAQERALEAQEYAISSADGSRGATQADLDKIQANIEYWNNWVIRLNRASGRGSVRQAVIGGTDA